MKKCYLTIYIVVLLLLSACQYNNDNSTPINAKEHTQSNLETRLVLELEKPDQVPYQIDIGNQIPMLAQYLKQFDEPENERERVRSTYLMTKNEKDYFLVHYSCGTKLCDQLLMEYDRGEVKTIKVSEVSFFQKVLQSNDDLVLLFGRNEGNQVIRNQIAMIDLRVFQKVDHPEDLSIIESFMYPILDIDWKDDTLVATLADIEDTSYESIVEWYEKGMQPTQQIHWRVR